MCLNFSIPIIGTYILTHRNIVLNAEKGVSLQIKHRTLCERNVFLFVPSFRNTIYVSMRLNFSVPTYKPLF